MPATIDGDRNTVRDLLIEAEAHIRDSADAESANAATIEAEKIVERRRADGRAVELLSPLLQEAEPEHVRLDAATYLLNHGHAELAVPVLESIELVRARVTLSHWRRQQAP